VGRAAVGRAAVGRAAVGRAAVGRGDELPGVFDACDGVARRLPWEDFDMMALVSNSGRSK